MSGPKKRSFRGTHYYPERKRWGARVRTAGFHWRGKNFHSEMEAMAHYNCVIGLLYKSELDVRAEYLHRLFTKVNNPWRGRPQPPTERDELGRLVLDIDHDYYVLIDQPDYWRLKDVPWFVRDNRVWGIAAAAKIKEAPYVLFDLTEMAWEIYGYHCVHLNGNTLDNRKVNLGPVQDIKPVRQHVSSPLTEEGFREAKEQALCPLRRQALAALRQWEAYQRWEANPVGAWIGATPQDPREVPAFKMFFNDREEEMGDAGEAGPPGSQ